MKPLVQAKRSKQYIRLGKFGDSNQREKKNRFKLRTNVPKNIGDANAAQSLYCGGCVDEEGPGIWYMAILTRMSVLTAASVDTNPFTSMLICLFSGTIMSEQSSHPQQEDFVEMLPCSSKQTLEWINA